MHERLDFLREVIAAGAALDAAERLGVLARLEHGPADARSLARDCAIGERGAHALLAALAGLGLLEAGADGAYRAATPHLVALAALRAPWHRLAEAVRGGRPLVAGDIPTGAEAFYPDTVPCLALSCTSPAERAADHLGAPGLLVLDVGAGAAPWSLALAARDPSCRVTAVDLPAVMVVTRGAVAAAGLEAQFRFLGGNMFAVDWGSAAYDLAIAGNLCHLFDEATNRRLLARLLEALRPGGRLAILDALPNERYDGPRPVVLYALGLLLRTSQGQAYPFSTYVGWLREAGYETVERFDLISSSTVSLITARRPR